MDEVKADIRARLANLPAAIEIGQPISHRIDHMLSGVRSQIAIKIYGEDLDALRGQADALRQRLASIPGIADLQIEKQVLAPQIKVRVDYAAAAQYGVPAPQVLATLQSLVEGEKVTQIVEGGRRFALVVKLPESARSIEGLSQILIETPTGRIPLSKVATIEDGDGPNQISRDDGKRRIVLSANASGRALSEIVADIRKVVAETKLPEGYFITLGGQFQAQEEASRLVGLLSIVSLVLMFVVLYSRYKSTTLSALIMVNIPLALVGAVIGLWLSGQPLSRGGAGRLHHAGRHLGAQRHPEGQPLHQPDALRGRDLRHQDDRARLARAAEPGADDGAGDGLRAGAAALRGRAPRHRGAAPGGRGDLLRPDQLDPARHLPHARDVLALRPQERRSADGRQGRRGALTPDPPPTHPTERTPMKTASPYRLHRPGHAAGTAHAAGEKHDHAHEHKPLHGGVVVEVKDMDYELVAKPRPSSSCTCATTASRPTCPRPARR
jgi:ABC-type nickel/cobalt efflux system permease component RcnA